MLSRLFVHPPYLHGARSLGAQDASPGRPLRDPVFRLGSCDGAAGGSSDEDRRDAALTDYFGTRHSRYRECVRVYQ